MKRKGGIARAFGLVTAAVLALGVFSPVGVKKAVAADTVTIEYQERDKMVIPDKYNTGCKGELTLLNTELENTVQKLISITGRQNGEDVKLWLKQGGSSYSFRFATYNAHVSGEVVVENIDFLGNKIETLDEQQTDRDVTLVFNNCKFGWVKKAVSDSRVKFIFNNCTITQFDGSNAEFNNCSFGGTPSDPMMPVKNVTVRDSYFFDIVRPTTDEWHTDGLQIFGEYGEKVGNLHFENCRFEVPYLRLDNTKATVNSCIMFQLERSDAEDVTFEDIVLNGGGTYSVYAAHKAKTGDWKSKDILFKNIKIGASKQISAFNPAVDKEVELQNVSGTDMLYVASVFKQDFATKFSVTNDTHAARRLRIVTDSGKDYYFDIKAGPTDETLLQKQFRTFEDIPADILVEVPEDVKYAVCLDVTDENNIRQIRFVNYTDKPVTVDGSVFGTQEARNSDILAEGDLDGLKCTLHYTLTKDYTLTITGSGAMIHYGEKEDENGNKYLLQPPWYTYKDYIKKVVIGDGITMVGVASFRNCFSLESLVLEGNVTTLSNSAFRNCTMLKYIDFDVKPQNFGVLTFDGVKEMDKILDALTTGVPIKERTPGDVNGDGSVDLKDGLFISQYLAGWNVAVNESNADVNGDNKVDLKDGLLLKQCLAGWKVELK